jgi:hypothetical protein
MMGRILRLWEWKDIVDEISENDNSIKNTIFFSTKDNGNYNIYGNEEDDDMLDIRLFDLKINYRVKRKYNYLDIMKSLYEPINN